MARGRHAKVPRPHTYLPITEFLLGPQPLPTMQMHNHYTQEYPLTSARSGEYIHCRLCNDTIPIIRHNPRTPLGFSTYHPQPPRQCRCGNLHALVDHRGIPRIYTDQPEAIGLSIPFKTQGQWLGHNSLLDYPQLAISQVLLDGPRPARIQEPPPLHTLLFHTDTIDLVGMDDDLRLPLIGFSRRPTHQERYVYYRQYAYTYGVIIRTPRMVYYPNGQTLLPHKPGPDVITCTHLNIEIGLLHILNQKGILTITPGYPYNIGSVALNAYIKRRNQWIQDYARAYRLNPQAAIRSLEHLRIRVNSPANEWLTSLPPIPLHILLQSDKLNQSKVMPKRKPQMLASA